jgi:hypothetical protein
MPDAESI